MMNDGIPLWSSDSERASKVKKRLLKNSDATFDKKIKTNCRYLKINDDFLFNNKSKRLIAILRPFFTILDLEVDRLSRQQL